VTSGAAVGGARTEEIEATQAKSAARRTIAASNRGEAGDMPSMFSGLLLPASAVPAKANAEATRIGVCIFFVCTRSVSSLPACIMRREDRLEGGTSWGGQKTCKGNSTLTIQGVDGEAASVLIDVDLCVPSSALLQTRLCRPLALQAYIPRHSLFELPH